MAIETRLSLSLSLSLSLAQRVKISSRRKWDGERSKFLTRVAFEIDKPAERGNVALPFSPTPSTPIRRVGYTAWRLPTSAINKYAFPPAPPPPLPSSSRAGARNCGGRDRVSAIKKWPLSALTFVPAIIIPGGISSSPREKSREERLRGEEIKKFSR